MRHEKMKKIYIPGRFLLVLFLILFSCGGEKREVPRQGDRINVIVSILPQKYFVERIGGERVSVTAIVLPGQSPATYEVTPQQMVRISSASLYFRIGVPFENIWVKKIADAGKNLKVIDTRKGIKLREIESFHHIKSILKNKKTGREKTAAGEDDHGHTGKDPHIWLDPLLVIQQAGTIARELVAADPGGRDIYRKNLGKFISDLRELNSSLNRLLSGVKNKNIVVFHPSWGYFTDRYGLNQLPVEIQGREPGQKELAAIIDFLKREKSRVIFIQKQFSSRSAETIASAVKGSVVKIDPLAENYIENMKEIGKVISGEK